MSQFGQPPGQVVVGGRELSLAEVQRRGVVLAVPGCRLGQEGGGVGLDKYNRERCSVNKAEAILQL